MEEEEESLHCGVCGAAGCLVGTLVSHFNNCKYRLLLASWFTAAPRIARMHGVNKSCRHLT